MQKRSCTAQSPFIALPLAVSAKVRGSTKATGGKERKRESETYMRLLIKLCQSSRKSQEFLQENVYLPLCIAALLCPKVWPKEQPQIQMNHWLWAWIREIIFRGGKKGPAKSWCSDKQLVLQEREKSRCFSSAFFLFFSLTSKASGLSLLRFPHGMSSLRLLQLGQQAALSINATHRIDNRDPCKEKTAFCAPKTSKYVSGCAREEGESRMHKKSRGPPKQLAVRTGQTQTVSQHPDVHLVRSILVSTEEPGLSTIRNS